MLTLGNSYTLSKGKIAQVSPIGRISEERGSAYFSEWENQRYLSKANKYYKVISCFDSNFVDSKENPMTPSRFRSKTVPLLFPRHHARMVQFQHQTVVLTNL